MFRELGLLPSSVENPIFVGPIEGPNPKLCTGPLQYYPSIYTMFSKVVPFSTKTS
jgi:hypothetical protein